jgi:hypothetical protein
MALLQNGGFLPLTLLIFTALVLGLISRITSWDTFNFWSTQPSVGVSRGPLGWMIATLKSITKSYEWAFQGYEKVLRPSPETLF